MCKLITGVQRRPSTAFRYAVYAQEHELKSQKDGIAAFMLLASGERRVLRELEDYDRVFREVYDSMDDIRFLVLHTRIGSSGERSLLNVHMFEHNGWMMAHNGFVNEYARSSWKPYCNSSYGSLDYDRKPWGYSRSWGGGVLYGNQQLLDESSGQIARWEMETQKLLELIGSCALCSKSPDGYCHKHKGAFEQLEILNEKIAGAIGIGDEGMEDVEVELTAGEEDAIEQPDEREMTAKERKDAYNGRRKKAKDAAAHEADDEARCCDTLQFLRSLPKKFDARQLRAKAEKDMFSGMALLFRPDTMENHLMVSQSKEAYAMGDNDSYGLFFSYKPETKLTLYDERGMFGVGVEYGYAIPDDVLKLTPGYYAISIEDIKTNASK